MQSIVQLPYNIYHALNKLRLRTRRSRAPIKKCALITKVRLLTQFYGMHRNNVRFLPWTHCTGIFYEALETVKLILLNGNIRTCMVPLMSSEAA